MTVSKLSTIGLWSLHTTVLTLASFSLVCSMNTTPTSQVNQATSANRMNYTEFLLLVVWLSNLTMRKSSIITNIKSYDKSCQQCNFQINKIPSRDLCHSVTAGLLCQRQRATAATLLTSNSFCW